MKILRYLFILPVIGFLFFTACGAETNDADTDAAQFALDNCSTTNTAPCTTAIAEADKLLAANANNSEAALIKSSALATRGGIDLLQVMSKLTETGTTESDTRKFRTIHASLVSIVTSLTDLRSAITTLSGITAPLATASNYKDFYWQLGILQTIEAFTMPSINAQPVADATVDIAATTAIDTDETANAEDDFVNADDNLILGGIANSTTTGWELVNFIREYYCILKTQAGTDGVATGFDAAQLRALMRCQLNTEAVITSLTTNAEFPGTTMVTCNTFDTALNGACNNAGDSEQ